MSGTTFGLLIFGIDGIAHGHSWKLIVTEMATAALLGSLFVWRQTQLAHPMMPIDIFRRPIFSLSITTSSCTFVAQGLAYVSLPFFFHTVLGRDATDTGILLTAWPLALACVAPIAGRLADRYHAGILGAIGLSSMTTGLVLTALLPAHPSALDIMWRLASGELSRGWRATLAFYPAIPRTCARAIISSRRPSRRVTARRPIGVSQTPAVPGRDRDRPRMAEHDLL